MNFGGEEVEIIRLPKNLKLDEAVKNAPEEVGCFDNRVIDLWKRFL